MICTAGGVKLALGQLNPVGPRCSACRELFTTTTQPTLVPPPEPRFNTYGGDSPFARCNTSSLNNSLRPKAISTSAASELEGGLDGELEVGLVPCSPAHHTLCPNLNVTLCTYHSPQQRPIRRAGERVVLDVCEISHLYSYCITPPSPRSTSSSCSPLSVGCTILISFLVNRLVNNNRIIQKKVRKK
jgi:hypothetical protein